jgi:hypothetical protein
MAKRKARRRKRDGWIRRRVGRWAWRRVHSWASGVKARARKAVAPKVIHSTRGNGAWERKFPDPRRRPPPLTETIEKLDEWNEEYEVTFGNGWKVPFQVDAYERVSLKQAAYDAGVLRHGEIVRSLQIVQIDPCNALAEESARRAD